MSRLARLPCRACGAETLHERDSCVHCATVYQVAPLKQRVVRKLWERQKTRRKRKLAATTTRTTAVNPAEVAP